MILTGIISYLLVGAFAAYLSLRLDVGLRPIIPPLMVVLWPIALAVVLALPLIFIFSCVRDGK